MKLTLWGILLTNYTALKNTTCLQDYEENLLQSLVTLENLQQLIARTTAVVTSMLKTSFLHFTY